MCVTDCLGEGRRGPRHPPATPLESINTNPQIAKVVIPRLGGPLPNPRGSYFCTFWVENDAVSSRFSESVIYVQCSQCDGKSDPRNIEIKEKLHIPTKRDMKLQLSGM